MVKNDGRSYRPIDRSRFKAFKQLYQKSGIYRRYDSYLTLMFSSSLVVFTSSFIIGALLHYFLFSLTLLQLLLAVFVFSCVISLIVSILFILYPLYRRNSRRKEIDTDLVYTTGYMGVLSAGGIPIERIFERVTQIERNPSIKDLSQMFITNIKMYGLDVNSALNDVILRSPSDSFSKLLVGITNTLETSGDLKSLLAFETSSLLHAKREQLKKTLATLSALGEVYISTMVMGPIVFIVMLTLLSVMGNVTFSLSPMDQLNLLVFFGLPTISTVFIIIFNGVLPKEG